MSSTRRVQTERLLEDVVRTLHSQGRSPLSSDVSEKMGKYLSEFPAGRPLPMPVNDAFTDASDVDEYNELLAHLAINLDVLYEASLRQVEESVDLISSLQSHLERLRKKRKRVETQVDDYLLGLYNTEGYFFARGDSFSDLSLVDLSMTSANINTTVGAAVLPAQSARSTFLSASLVSDPIIEVRDSSGGVAAHDAYSSFGNAVETSLRNITWAFESRSNLVEEMVATVTFDIGAQDAPVVVSRLTLEPFGVTPLQVFIETSEGNRFGADGGWVSFGNRIQTSTREMSFSDEARPARRIRLTLRKTQPDYTERLSGKFYYRYIFGARSLGITHQSHDSFARVVSVPLRVPDDLDAEIAVDAVSLSVKELSPGNTSIDYYVAAADDEELSFEQLSWRRVTPVESDEGGEKSVRFGGASQKLVRITEDPEQGDLRLIPPRTTGPLSDRNPSPNIIPGADVYRIAELDEQPLLNSMRLYEGVNTTRIYSRVIDATRSFSNMTLDHWANLIANEYSTLTVDHGRINVGNEFFYGGDVGAVGRDVYIEAILQSDTSYDTFLEEFIKLDSQSKKWDVRVYLNTKPIGELPLGVDKALLPWNIRQGTNHIAIIARIPNASGAFMGSLALLGNSDITGYGRVRLSEWSYTDFFNLQHNEVDGARVFSVHNGEIVARRPHSGHFELNYATATGRGPRAVRLRADLRRSPTSPFVTPQLNEYRLRFAYADREG